jgi:predicted Zn-dependent protease
MRWKIAAPVLALVLGLAGCDISVTTTAPPGAVADDVTLLTPDEAVRSFTEVVRALEPVAERECRRRTTDANCDFLIAVDPRVNAPANAFQSLDDQGRPVLTFTVALIASTQNADEMAFVMGHEAAHHIAGHLERQRLNAEAGAVIFGNLATLTGTGDVESARQLGAVVGARTFSKEFELEADALGTVITYRAGYDPRVGAIFFTRIPDPGDQFLGTHPPNAARIETVNATLRSLGV